MNSKFQKYILIPVSALILFASACGTAAKTPAPLNVNEAVSTLLAMTAQAAATSAALHTPTPLPTATPTFAKPMLYINDNAPCRTGTTTNFKISTTLKQGMTFDLIGKEATQSAWLIRVPNVGSCWVMAGDGSPTGDYESLPIATPQPSTQTPPGTPVFAGWPWFCTYVDGALYKATVDISWIDPAHDANGVRVYRDGTQITDLPLTTTSYVDTFNVTIGSNVTYTIQAYNDAGTSPQHSMTISSICK